MKTATSKGQVTIPLEIRKKYIQQMAGILSSESKVVEVLLKNREKDKAKEK